MERKLMVLLKLLRGYVCNIKHWISLFLPNIRLHLVKKRTS